MDLFKNLSIGKKLLIILLLISILPLFIITYGFYSLGKAKLTEQTIHILEVQSKNVEVSINHYVDYKFKHLSRIANILQLTRILKNVKEQSRIPHQTISSLRAKLRIVPDFLSFTLMDTEGNVVLSTSDMAIIDVQTGLKPVCTRPFFFEAVKGEKYVSAPSLDEGKPSIYFSIPIKHTNKIVGVLAAQCDAEELWKLIETETGRVGAGNAVILSNSDGVRIAHSTMRALIFKSWIPLKPEVEEQIMKEKRYGSDIKKIASTDIPVVMDAVTMPLPPRYFQHRLVIGKGIYHSAIRVMDNGWRIISTVPEATFLEPVHTNIFYMGIVGSIIVCMVIAASIIIGRLSTKRIHTLASISKEITRGNLAKRIPFVNGDEIGQLGKIFNIMTASIKRRIEQLGYLNEVSLEIHSHIEIESLLQNLINISRRVINAEMGALALLDENGEDIKYFKVSMPNPCRIKEQPTGKGLLDAVIKKGQTIRLDDVTKDWRSIKLPENHPPIRTLMGVPLVTNSRTVGGGLFLANKANDERFTLEDEEILRTIAYQASVAIENARLYGQVQQFAVTDGLTGLLNHKKFHKRLDEDIEGSKRYHYMVSLLMIDIDHFKNFNDNYGHQVGDRILKTIADVIKSQIRIVDVCARYGGEEFAVIVRDTDLSPPLKLSERIRSCVHAYPFKHDGVRSQLSVSIGIASFPKDANNAEDLIKKADEALYTAKETGRNKVCCYKPT